jgi:hypothetical protein
MAMNGNNLGDEIKAAIDLVVDKTDRTAIFQAIGTAIVTHLTTNAKGSGVDSNGDTHDLVGLV